MDEVLYREDGGEMSTGEKNSLEVLYREDGGEKSKGEKNNIGVGVQANSLDHPDKDRNIADILEDRGDVLVEEQTQHQASAGGKDVQTLNLLERRNWAALKAGGKPAARVGGRRVSGARLVRRQRHRVRQKEHRRMLAIPQYDGADDDSTSDDDARSPGMLVTLNVDGMVTHVGGGTLTVTDDTRGKVTKVAEFIKMMERKHGAPVFVSAHPESWVGEDVTIAEIPGRRWFNAPRTDTKGKGGCAASVDERFAAQHRVRQVRPPQIGPEAGARALCDALWLQAEVGHQKFVYFGVVHLASPQTLRVLKATQGEMIMQMMEHAEYFATKGTVYLMGDMNRMRVPAPAGARAADVVMGKAFDEARKGAGLKFLSKGKPTRWKEKEQRDAARLRAGQNLAPSPKGARCIDHVLGTSAGAVMKATTEYACMAWTDHAAQMVMIDWDIEPIRPGTNWAARSRSEPPRPNVAKIKNDDKVREALRTATDMGAVDDSAMEAAGVQESYESWAAVVTAAQKAHVPMNVGRNNRHKHPFPKVEARVFARRRRQEERMRAAQKAGKYTAAAHHRKFRNKERNKADALLAKGEGDKAERLVRKMRLAKTSTEAWKLSNAVRAAKLPRRPPPGINLCDDEGNELPTDKDKAAYATKKWEEVGQLKDGGAHGKRWEKELKEVWAAVEEEIANTASGSKSWMYRLFTKKEVAKALKKCKAGKATGPDMLSYELLQALHPSAMAHLRVIFNMVLQSGEAPQEWGTAVVKLLEKPGRDHAKWTGYRCISLVSCVAKLFERCMKVRIEMRVHKHATSDRQYGFRPGWAAEDALLAHAATTGMGKTEGEAGGKVYSCYLDVRRAFPSMDRRAMLVRLYKEGKVTGRVWRVVANMYKDVKSQIWQGEAKGPTYNVGTGAREGSVLSPICYSAFIDGMIGAVEAAVDDDGTPAGAAVAGHNDLYFATSAFCDDFVMSSDTPTGLQAMMKAAGAYANEHLFAFGREKTNVVVFGSNGAPMRWRNKEGRMVSGWTMPALYKESPDEDDAVECKDSYVYLGVKMHRDRSWRHHHDAVAKAHGRLKAQAIRDRATGAAGCGGPVAVMIWNATATGALDRAALATAASDTTAKARDEEYGNVEKLSRAAAKNEIGGRHNGPTEVAYEEAGIKSTRDRREAAQAKAAFRVMRMPATQPVRKLLTAAAADKTVLGKGWHRAATAACKAASGELGKPSGRKRWEDNKVVNAEMKKVHAKRATKAKFDKKKDRKKAQSVFPDKVHAARIAKHGHAYPAETARPHTVLGYSMMRQLSSSTHFLNGCTHQGEGETRKDRKGCGHCGATVESEEHALLWCPKHEGERRMFLEATGWPRGGTQLAARDAVLWMVPDARQAKCSEEEMATVVQEFCQSIAWTRSNRKAKK